MLKASSWCLFCQQSLNNSALSYCSCLNRPFAPIPPTHPHTPLRVEGNNSSIHGWMYVRRQRAPLCCVASCFPSHMLCHTLGIACVRPSPFHFFLSFLSVFFGWAGLFFITVPSWSHRRSSRSWTLRGAAVWCAIRGPEPQSQGEAVHNSLGLNLLFFITPTPLDSPQCYYYSFTYLFICLLVFPQTSRRGFFRSPFTRDIYAVVIL